MAERPVRPAATVVVARPARPRGDGVEVLMLRRAPASRFVPGFAVFPGGAVDPGDEELARAWFGDAREEARACAVRELAEEAGLVATAHGVVEARSRRPGAPGLPPPRPGDLPEIGRWIAPEFIAVRFDARFYALSAGDADMAPEPDGTEIVGAWWAMPRDVLEASAREEFPLAWPTRVTLEAVAGCRTVAEVLALKVPQVPPSPEAVPEAMLAPPEERA